MEEQGPSDESQVMLYTEEDNSRQPKDYEYDDLLRLVGGFGRYPMMLYAFTCVMSIPVGMQQLVQVFYGATPTFTCAPSSTAVNYTCAVGKCCANCSSYEFHGSFTSAVSEVRYLCVVINNDSILLCLFHPNVV